MRCDNDSWDITSSVGATALMVAAVRAAETRRGDALFTDPYAEPLISDTGSSAWQRFCASELGEPDKQEWSGLVGSTVVARCYFDGFDEALRAGVRQVVILASGLDARAYRLEWPDGTVVFELDQPKVLDYKAGVFERYGVAAGAERRAVPIDLRQDWPAALRANGFRPDVATAWLAEGLLGGYLPAQAQDRLFENVVALSAPGSRIGINYSSDTVGGNGDAALVRERMDEARRRRAQIMAGFGIDLNELLYTEEQRTEPREWFAERGWAVTHSDPTTVLAERGRTATEPALSWMSARLLVTAVAPT